MIGIRGRCPTEPSSSSGLHPSPSNARARRGCTCRLRAQNGMPMTQSPRSSEARLSMRWAYLILPSRSRRRSEGAVVPRYRHKPRARSLGCGNWRLSPNALVSIPVGPAGPAHRFLRAAPEALADSVPDHRDVRQPTRPLRRPHVREPVRQGVRIRDQPRADRRGHGVHRGAGGLPVPAHACVLSGPQAAAYPCGSLLG